MMAWLSLMAIAAGVAATPCEVVTTARAAQVRLARTLAEADAIESFAVERGAPGEPPTVTFSIIHDGEALRLVATTARDGTVTALVIAPVGPAVAERDRLTWLAVELDDASAVVRLVAADRGGVLLSTSDG